MPVYEYECAGCGKRLEVLQKFSDPLLTSCEACGGDLKKLISQTSFVLKGTGWYVTDYASPERKKEAEEGKPAEGKESPGKKTDAAEAATDSRHEAKPETKTEAGTASSASSGSSPS